MNSTLLSDVKNDVITFELPAFSDEHATTHDVTVFSLGRPDVEETQMCAKCIGECKVF